MQQASRYEGEAKAVSAAAGACLMAHSKDCPIRKRAGHDDRGGRSCAGAGEGATYHATGAGELEAAFDSLSHFKCRLNLRHHLVRNQRGRSSQVKVP
jgi:hypothetical protein